MRLFLVLRTRDRFLVSFFSVAAVGALLFWVGAIYLSSTKAVPDYGGEYTEGMVSQPRYINPILSQTSEADADISQLVYEGLFGYDADARLVNRLADHYAVSEDGKTYTVMLKQGAKWHDGEEVTADDVLFTATAIQDPAYKSPLRGNWLGIDVAVVDRYTLTFTLKKPYFGFLENLVVGILPKHIWAGIAPDNFLLADYNLAPIGSGPYRFSDSAKDSSGNMTSIELRAFSGHLGGAPYISTFTFRFYPDEAMLTEAYRRKEILGIDTVTPDLLSQIATRKSTRVYDIPIPRLFAVFFNTTKNAALADDTVRQAFATATDRQAIIDQVLLGQGIPAFSPFLPFMAGYASDLTQPTFDLAKANALLDGDGWRRGEDGVRSRNGTVLALELLTPDWSELVKTAGLLKSEWEAIGARVNVTVLGAVELQQNAIRPREYQALLFGEAATLDPDPYSFWHSSGKHDPGLNLSLFDNKQADDALTALREELDPTKRDADYRLVQSLILAENPAVFLYSPAYLYAVSDTVQGIDVRRVDAPVYRLANAQNWYIKTKRVRK